REGGKQLDLFLGERSHGEARQPEHADRGSFAQEGRADYGVKAANFLYFRQLVFRISLSVENMHGRAFKQRATGHALAPRFKFQARKLSFELRRKSEVCARPE